VCINTNAGPLPAVKYRKREPSDLVKYWMVPWLSVHVSV
jgi:hypothetical protein